MITIAGLTPSVDLTYLVDHLELGRIHRPTDVVRRAGGKPLNLARAAAALGADVSIVAVLGGWTGDWLADELARAQIAVRRVTTPVLTRTCVSISSADSEDLTELYEYAEPIPADVWTHAREALTAELADRPGWLVIAGGPPRGLPPTGLAELAELAHHAGCRVAADTHGASLVPLLHSRPELVKINRSEAAAVLGVDPGTALAQMAARRAGEERRDGRAHRRRRRIVGSGRGRSDVRDDGAEAAGPLPGRQRRRLPRRAADRPRPGRRPGHRAAAGHGRRCGERPDPGPGSFATDLVGELAGRPRSPSPDSGP